MTTRPRRKTTYKTSDETHKPPDDCQRTAIPQASADDGLNRAADAIHHGEDEIDGQWHGPWPLEHLSLCDGRG